MENPMNWKNLTSYLWKAFLTSIREQAAEQIVSELWAFLSYLLIQLSWGQENDLSTHGEGIDKTN